MMVHDYSREMEKRGHEVKIWCLEGRQDGKEGWLYKWCDIVISHLGRSLHSQKYAREAKKPFIWLAHSDQFRVQSPTICNSYWLKEFFDSVKIRGEGESVVCYPICDYSKFNELADGQYITLIGLNRNKGGVLLRHLAERMQGYQFLGVAGCYGGQEITQPDNVKVIVHPCYVEKVLKDTGILLIMSEFESFSRCAVEAMSMGIPIVSTETKGVRETCGSAAYYIKDREDLGGWQKAIEYVNENKDKWSKKSFRRSKAIQRMSIKHIETFENLLIKKTKHENQNHKVIQG